MSGKDLLAVLAMIVPSFLLIAIIAFTLALPADVATAPSGAGFVHASSTEKVRERRDVSTHAKLQIATQKRMRGPWEKPAFAKSLVASEPLPCDSIMIDQKITCFYW